MTKTTVFMTLAMLLLSMRASLAGTGYPMKCDNCGFSETVMIGGGIGFSQITGFCVKSKQFVYLQWQRGEKEPKPVAKVWDPVTGRTFELYRCPDCDQPFIAFPQKSADEEGPGFKHCPKCGKPEFHVDKSQGIMMYD